MSADLIDALPEIHDFDFLFGRWTVVHRRLKARGVGSQDWDTFPATAYCEPRLGGLVNVDEIQCPTRGWTGLSLRTLDVRTREWSVYWINSLNGQLQPPVRGRFNADGCVLEGPDSDGDRPIIARYIWSDISPDSARWTQAFSYDEGETWETNWVMDFTRAAA